MSIPMSSVVPLRSFNILTNSFLFAYDRKAHGDFCSLNRIPDQHGGVKRTVVRYHINCGVRV
jgi:hypothetical protein